MELKDQDRNQDSRIKIFKSGYQCALQMFIQTYFYMCIVLFVYVYVRFELGNGRGCSHQIFSVTPEQPQIFWAQTFGVQHLGVKESGSAGRWEWGKVRRDWIFYAQKN